MRASDFMKATAAFTASVSIAMATTWCLVELFVQAVDAELDARSAATREAKTLALEVRP